MDTVEKVANEICKKYKEGNFTKEDIIGLIWWYLHRRSDMSFSTNMSPQIVQFYSIMYSAHTLAYFKINHI